MYDPDKAAVICEYLAEGQSLRKICEFEGMPAYRTVMTWLDEQPEFQQNYARARSIADDIEFDGLSELADESPALTMDGRVDPGWVAWQRNRIDVRKWTLARKQPKKYGDKVETIHSGELGIRRIERVITRNPAD